MSSFLYKVNNRLGSNLSVGHYSHWIDIGSEGGRYVFIFTRGLNEEALFFVVLDLLPLNSSSFLTQLSHGSQLLKLVPSHMPNLTFQSSFFDVERS